MGTTNCIFYMRCPYYDEFNCNSGNCVAIEHDDHENEKGANNEDT